MRSKHSVTTFVLATVVSAISLATATFAQQPVNAVPPADMQKIQTVMNSLFDFGKPTSGNQPVDVVPSAQPTFGVPAKQPGVIRFGIVSTASKAPEDQKQAALIKMGEMLSGVAGTSPNDAVLLTSKLEPQIVAEARGKGCDYILKLDTESKIKAGGGISKILKFVEVGAGSLDFIPFFPGAGTRGVWNAVEKANQVKGMSSRAQGLFDHLSKITKKGHSVTIRYSLHSVGGAQVVAPASETITASDKGEPILETVLINIGNKVLAAIPQAK